MATKQATSPGHWTTEQWLGITTVGQSLLVSAAAGSGKTAMLAERCAFLVCDAPQPCDIDELLVVTFTDAAAGEMKTRITQSLRERAQRESNGRAAQQLKLVDTAHVSTLHSFCSRVLREHFHLVGLDPAFSVLDGEEAKLLRSEVARELFEHRYELDDSGEFQRFVDAYGDGDDQRLVRLVIKAHETLTSLVDPAKWLDDARRRIEQAIRLPLSDSEMGRELHERVACELAALRERCDRAIQQVRRLDGFDKYLTVVRESGQIIDHWARVFRKSGLTALKEESAIEFERLPAVSNSVPNKALAKAAVDSVRESMKAGTWRELLRFSPDEWVEGLRAILPHANVFLELVDQFEKRYRAEKDSSRVLDFADLERFTLGVLRDGDSMPAAPSAAARSFHKRFKHVLVDEYQDINEVQDAILTLVSRECICDGRRERANLFCVGDVKQSIYRFRLAEARRFLDRQKQFRADGGKRMGSVIDLQKNFRSRSLLLDAINGVFARLMTSESVDIAYDDSHRLHAGAVFPPADGLCTFSGSPIEMHLLPAKLETGEQPADCDDANEADLDRAEREAVLVARRIREMMGMDGNTPMCVTDKGESGAAVVRPLRYRDVVILLRAMKYKADQYADVLRQHGIPVHAESGSGYFESTEVSDVLSLLSLLNNARQDIAMAAVLRSPLARISDPEESLARIRLAYPRGSGLAFHEAVTIYAAEHDDDLSLKLRDFLAELSRLRELAQRRPLADLIQHIYEQSGYLAYCAGLVGGEQRVANLQYLLERAQQFGTFHRQGLARFLEFIDNLRNESDLGQPSIASEAQDVVRIISVHRSKGLEFPVVFLPDLGKNINLDDCHGPILLDRKIGLGMSVIDEIKRVRYPSLALTLVRARIRQQALAEEMRVLYVAMTRAREHLVLVGTCSADAEEQWRARWAGHDGAFPTDLILGTSNMLGWLGPVAAATGLNEEIIRIRTHPAEEVATWRTQAKRRQLLTPEQEKLARLEPLHPPPQSNPVAEELIARVTAVYPHEVFSRLHAAEAVSQYASTPGKSDAEADGRTKLLHGRARLLHGRARLLPSRDPFGKGGSAGASPSRAIGQPAPQAAAPLAKPRFMLEEGSLAAIDAGEATHLVLQHLDFHRGCDRSDLAAQISELVQRKLIAPAQAKCVDIDSIEWLMQSSAGELLRRHAGELRREVPIYFADRPLSSADPQDQVMVRGRIDVLIPLPGGSIVIDYKTDRVEPDAVENCAQTYTAQVAAYRRAVEAITAAPLHQALLVFLHPRVVHPM